MDLYNAKNNSMPQQVQENKNNIELLDERVKQNTEDIKLLSPIDISDLRDKVNENSENIIINSIDIETNKNDILSNTIAIAGNTTAIAANTTAIAGNTTAIAGNTTAIAANTTAIAGNTTAIAANTTAIAGNTTAINNITEQTVLMLAIQVQDYSIDLSSLDFNGSYKYYLSMRMNSVAALSPKQMSDNLNISSICFVNGYAVSSVGIFYCALGDFVFNATTKNLSFKYARKVFFSLDYTNNTHTSGLNTNYTGDMLYITRVKI